jgi:hypothetical protein
MEECNLKGAVGPTTPLEYLEELNKEKDYKKVMKIKYHWLRLILQSHLDAISGPEKMKLGKEKILK